MSNEPNIIRILDNEGNFAGYPITITKAVLDFKTQQSLDLVLEQFVNKLAIIVKDNALLYHLEVGGKQSGSSINVNNNWLESVSFDYNTRKFKFIFTTRQGKVTIYVNPDLLINLYYVDDKTIILEGNTLKVKPGVFASSTSGELAETALQEISANSDTLYLSFNVSDKFKENGKTLQIINVQTLFGSISEETEGIALVSDIINCINELKIYINNTISEIGCSFIAVNNTNYPDITSYFNNG